MPGKIPISDAKAIGQKRGCPVVVIFAIEEGAERYSITTWGKTKLLCGWASCVGKDISKAILDDKVLGDVANADDPYSEIECLRKRTCAICNDTGKLDDARVWDCGETGRDCPYCPQKVDEMLAKFKRLRKENESLDAKFRANDEENDLYREESIQQEKMIERLRKENEDERARLLIDYAHGLSEIVRKESSLAAELKRLRAWMDNNFTFCEPGEAPVLGRVSKRIWYHATDDVESYPFSHVARKAAEAGDE